MKAFTVSKNDSGQRLDKFVSKVCPSLPLSQVYKYIRLKRVKVNGKKSDLAYKLAVGDLVEMYINDEFFLKHDDDAVFKNIKPKLDIVYEDEHILLVDKKVGVVVHEDDNGTADTLINNIKAYLYQKGSWDPEKENSFTPALCNRIDRGTGGIVISAKTAAALRILNDKIKEGEVEKYYLCLCHGNFQKPSGTIKNFLLKDEKRNKVFVYRSPHPGAKTAITDYKVMSFKKGISLVECHLQTGRTHQIRAHMADMGHPLVGDTKYGTADMNRGFPYKSQCLYSYKLRFDFKGDCGELNYLKGREFSAENIYFMDFFKNL